MWALPVIPLTLLLGFLVQKRISPLVLLFLMFLALLTWFHWN
jgi:hypothetical protein